MRTMISKSFLNGFIKTLDLSGTKEWPELSDDKMKDYKALRGDWENVGEFIRKGTRDIKRAKY